MEHFFIPEYMVSLAFPDTHFQTLWILGKQTGALNSVTDSMVSSRAGHLPRS